MVVSSVGFGLLAEVYNGWVGDDGVWMEDVYGFIVGEGWSRIALKKWRSYGCWEISSALVGF